MVSLRLITVKRQDCSEYSSMPYELWCSQSDLKTGTLLGPTLALNIIPSILFRWSLSWLSTVLSHAFVDASTDYSTTANSRAVFLYSFSSWVLCSEDLSCLVLPRMFALSPQIKESAELHVSFPSWHCSLKILLRKQTGQSQVYFISFPSLKYHCTLLFDVQRLEKHISCIWSNCLPVSGRIWKHH